MVALGDATLTIIAPGPEAAVDTSLADNDRALAAVVELGDARVLLTADAGALAIDAILAMGLGGIDALELPHHGSWNPEAANLVATLDPPFVLQSTGWRRVGDRRWELPGLRGGRWWAITARDGAAWVRLDADGSATSGTLR